MFPASLATRNGQAEGDSSTPHLMNSFTALVAQAEIDGHENQLIARWQRQAQNPQEDSPSLQAQFCPASSGSAR